MLRSFAILLTLLASANAADLHANLVRIMQGRTGTAVVVDVASGKIIATYGPKVAARRLARPGSAFKPFTLLALLQWGKLSPNDSFQCRRNLRVGAHDLSCSHPPTGQLQAVSALAYSCNDFFATFGKRLTAEELRAAFVKAGLTSATGLMPDEAVGSIRLATDGEERQLQAIGEGEMKTTPLEMVAAYRRLALRRTAPDASAAERTLFSGLEAATDYGMARMAAINSMKVAGKTGTSRADEGAWTHAWFAGYAPAEKPQIAVVVFLEKGTGPADAAALGGEIFRAWGEGQP